MGVGTSFREEKHEREREREREIIVYYQEKLI